MYTASAILSEANIAVRIIMLVIELSYTTTLGNGLYHYHNLLNLFTFRGTLAFECLPQPGPSLVFAVNGINIFLTAFTWAYIKNSSIGAQGAFYIWGSALMIVRI